MDDFILEPSLSHIRNCTFYPELLLLSLLCSLTAAPGRDVIRYPVLSSANYQSLPAWFEGSVGPAVQQTFQVARLVQQISSCAALLFTRVTFRYGLVSHGR